MIEAMRASVWKPIAFVAVCFLAALMAGCRGSEANKAGGSSEKTVVLTLADHETSTSDVGRWASEVERLSGGTLRIEIRNRWRDKEREYDRGTIADVRSGRVDIAKIAARSWDEVGVMSFRALVAPLLVDSYRLEQRVFASDLPARMLPAVEKLDLVGLAVLPGLLRKPLGVKRILRRPSDFAGARIGIRPGGVARMTFDALGSESLAYVPGDSAEVSRLDGAELDVDVIKGSDYNRGAGGLTANVNLWPRVLTLVMNRRAFDALSNRQQEALRSAADAVRGRTMRDVLDLERGGEKALCRRGLAFVTATPAELAALGEALRPVYADLERDDETRRFVGEIRAMKHGLGESARAQLFRCDRAARHTPAAASPIDGVYRSTVTRTELLRDPAYEQGEDNPSNYGRFTLKIARGRFELTGSAEGIPSGGKVTVNGDQVSLRPTYPPDIVGERWVYRWSAYRRVLSFKKVTAGPTGSSLIPNR
jgi:TRAP-type C4-dicarboxylate transport system substrate-binding protein